MHLLSLISAAAAPIASHDLEIGSPDWFETLRRLREGPNTARERRMLQRRRARLHRIGEHEQIFYKGRKVAYCDTDSIMTEPSSTPEDRIYRVGVGPVADDGLTLLPKTIKGPASP